jgi:hypothetical protein
MNGVNLAVAGHPINLSSPQNITGGVTSQAFSMKGAEHVTIFLIWGAVPGSPPTVPTSVVVNQCTNAAGANATPLASFRYYYQTAGGAGNDIMNGAQQALANAPSLPPNWTTSTAGITAFPATMAGSVLAIEIDAAELETALVDVVGPITEYPYLQVVVGNGAVATFCCILAVLTGLRYAYNVGVSFTV